MCALTSDENMLLPLAHRCWPALLKRLTSDDPLAVLRAFGVRPHLGNALSAFLCMEVALQFATACRRKVAGSNPMVNTVIISVRT